MEEGGPQFSKKEKKGLQSIWQRIRRLFRHKPQALPAKPAAPASATKSTPTPPASGPKAAQSPGEPALDSQYPATDKQSPIEVDDMQENTPLPDEPLALPPRDPLSEYPNDQELRFYKAKAICARYNIELTEADWVVRPKAQHERVSKPIRQRVRYTCHNCSTSFGYDKICIGCQHRRCTRCSRYPPRKDRSRAARETTAQQQQQQQQQPQDTDGDNARNSIEGACHECQTGFELGTQECPNCHHQICDRCIRETTISIDESSRETDEQRAPTSRSTAVS
ncbi:uncharacterized protein PV06_09087 [Exophiala oligosperma]|uniref:RING-type domain-containing protein n=1 Tax=Exophiala oligosperma TaxID=215243 RepID=A0A0D2D831_9EURO|nr:uncharacterized protein PV06_09087 [Exophiala oligosperma]KIW39303.1 hypothetical protein PV06_09087 [Exophiala oligosperma]